MKNFKQDRGFRNFDGRGFGDNRRSFGNRGMDRPRMVKAICDQCGRECELPFKPTGEKPVYCSDCFEKIGGRDNNRRFENRDNRGGRDYRSERPRNNEMEMVNKKLDQIIEMLSAKKEIKTVKKTKKVEAPVETQE